MQLNGLADQLAGQVRSKETQRQFEAAKERHPALQQFDSAQDLVAELASQYSTFDGCDDGVMAALVEEYQRRKHSCWSTVLLSIFSRLLASIGARYACRLTDEGAMFVIENFLEAANDLGRGKQRNRRRRLGCRLVWNTRSKVLRTLNRESVRELREHGTPLDQAPALVFPITPEDMLIEQAEMRVQSLEELLPLLDEHFTEEELDLVVGTYGKGKRIADLAREQLADGGDEEEFVRLSNRLRRRRCRLVGRIRQTVQRAVEQQQAQDQRSAA